MSGSEAQIEAMQRRLESMAAREQVLIEALNEALQRADRRLLDEVRHVTVEHEARRMVILTELQDLAQRLGAFALSTPPPPTIEYDVAAVDTSKSALDDGVSVGPPNVEAPEQRPTEQGGDWRKAAENIGKELDCYIHRAGSLRNLVAGANGRS